MEHPHLIMKMKSGGKIVIELYPEYAPNAVNALIEMVSMHAYDNLSIQRIVPDFVLQPWYDEKRMGKEFQYLIEAECENNGYHNPLRFETYTVGMAGDGKCYASSSSFFICVDDENVKRLQKCFFAVGKVIDGFEELDRLMHVELRKIEVEEDVQIYEPVIVEEIATISLKLHDYIPSIPIKFLPS